MNNTSRTPSTVDYEAARAERLEAECERLRAAEAASRSVAERLQSTFNLRWDADMRAIKRWQAAHPGNDLTWPDRADMVVWLLDQSDAAFRRGAEAMRRATLAVTSGAVMCPFDDPNCQLDETDPCPVCGDLGTPSDSPSHCKSASPRIVALPIPEDKP